MGRAWGLRLRIAGLAALACVASGSASPAAEGKPDAWWGKGWQFRKKVTVAAAELKGTASEVPVLVRLHTGNFSFPNAKPDGSDLRFVGEDGTALKHHVERFDPTEEMGLVWVKLPAIGGDAGGSFWLYYGNKDAAAEPDAAGTYDASQALAYHFAESEGAPKDSSSKGNNASEFTGRLGAAGPVGQAAGFSGVSKLVTAGSPSLNLSAGFTFSAWVRPAGPQSAATLLSREEPGKSLAIGLEGPAVTVKIVNGKDSAAFSDPKAVLPPGGWHHLAVAVDANRKVAVFVDGAQAAAGDLAASLPDLQSKLVIGADGAGAHGFRGDLDEVQLSVVARPEAWIAGYVKAQGPESTLLGYGAEEVHRGGAFATVLEENALLVRTAVQNMTLDAWAVIAILALMGLGSAYVAFTKIMLIRANEKGNEAFLEAFRSSQDLLTLAGAEDGLDKSSLYEVYRGGRQELNRRLGGLGAQGGDGKISRKALNAFRAAIEERVTREGQHLNDWMILLIISISGGPFLGLLGTVWGVMNTFSGVANAGEVNMTTIAPGISSALTATIAGLLVSIPALFVYNYLAAKIKNVIIDMHVFVDEFTCRADELYGVES